MRGNRPQTTSEPSDEQAAAPEVALGAAFEATLYPPGDHDHYRVEVPAPGYGRLRVEVVWKRP